MTIIEFLKSDNEQIKNNIRDTISKALRNKKPALTK